MARFHTSLALAVLGFLVCRSGGVAAAPPSTGEQIAAHFQRLTRNAAWERVEEVPLGFRTYHPQGMIRVGDRIFLSSVQVIDRSAGLGHGHLFELGLRGELRRQITLDDGSAYHPGGIDFDGKRLWVPVAEYRPDSRSVVYRVDPDTLHAERVFEFPDHLGALVCDRVARRLVAVSWGSRRLYRWDLQEQVDAPRDAQHPTTQLNASHYVDYQDGQHLPGTGYALFGGLAQHRPPQSASSGFVLGGLDLLDLQDLRPVHQVPVSLQTSQAQTLLQNPWTVFLRGNGLRFLFIPEDDRSTLYIYDVEP